MKFLSLIFFLVSLTWTWSLIHSIPRVSFETHVGIHDNLAFYIQEALAAKKPDAKDFQIHRLWTEETKADTKELKAHFTYSFAEEVTKTRTTIQGWAILQPLPENEGEEPGTKWLVKEVHPTSDSVVFEEGSVIRAFEDAVEMEEPAAEAAPSEENLSEPAPSEESP